MKKSTDKNVKARSISAETSCPYLGFIDDPGSCTTYPIEGHLCHRVKKPTHVRRSYQAKVCLTKEFGKCPVYQDDWKGNLPADIRARKAPNGKQSCSFPAIIIIGAIIILLLVLLGEQLSGLASFIMNRETMTLPVVTNSTGIFSPTERPTMGPYTPPANGTDPIVTSENITPIPSQTATSTTESEPSPGPAVMTPFGPNEQYLLHRVRSGESLTLISGLYQTTIDVIVAQNFIVPGSTLWPGEILVIFPGRMDSDGLPRFRVLFLEEEVLISEFAAEQSASEEDLRFYNSLGPGEIIPARRWIIIPIG
ncbi:MAG: LysM peptidoglycan-binding domain-containing protein [Chloroflexi bacterium]|nr:LysM peptidoglycan-binding domain-containing protein [Chloroflexota bacterium]